MRERDRGLACGVGINCLCQSEIIVCIQCGCGLVKLAVLKVWCERLDLVQKEHEYCLDFYPYIDVYKAMYVSSVLSQVFFTELKKVPSRGLYSA